jgi:hypothetical protein
LGRWSWCGGAWQSWSFAYGRCQTGASGRRQKTHLKFLAVRGSIDVRWQSLVAYRAIPLLFTVCPVSIRLRKGRRWLRLPLLGPLSHECLNQIAFSLPNFALMCCTCNSCRSGIVTHCRRLTRFTFRYCRASRINLPETETGFPFVATHGEC